MQWRWLSVLALAASACACSPSLDWREVRPEGGAALALFPCRPVAHTRSVRLAGADVEMAVHACRAGEAVYALGVADVADPARVTSALRELRDAAASNIGADALLPLAHAMAGSTPNPQAGAWRFDGRHPGGSPLHEALVLFAHGTRVYQATVLGARLDAAAVQTFVDGLRVASR